MKFSIIIKLSWEMLKQITILNYFLVHNIILIRDVRIASDFIRRYCYRSIPKKGSKCLPQFPQTLQNKTL